MARVWASLMGHGERAVAVAPVVEQVSVHALLYETASSFLCERAVQDMDAEDQTVALVHIEVAQGELVGRVQRPVSDSVQVRGSSPRGPEAKVVDSGDDASRPSGSFLAWSIPAKTRERFAVALKQRRRTSRSFGGARNEISRVSGYVPRRSSRTPRPVLSRSRVRSVPPSWYPTISAISSTL